MKTNKLLLLGLFAIGFGIEVIAQCEINVSSNPMQITCGQSAVLSAYGSSTGQVILNEDFNGGGFGAGWGSTPGATNFSNPCSPGGVDGTTHAWMDNNTSVPRTLTSAPYNLSAATAGVTICFDLLFAEQGDAAPCEGPDEPDEGVYLQYSTDGGATWVDIYYFDPNGGNDPQLTNWNNWCFQLPAAAITSNTLIRWHQTADSGADYDHWGIDNVQIFQNDINAEVIWLHDGYSYGLGNPGGPNPNAVSPTTTTTYTAQITTGGGQVCTADITVIVLDPVYDVTVAANPTNICAGECSDITGTGQIVLDPGGIETYENNEFSLVASGSASVNVNVQGINTNNIYNGLIQNVTVNGFSFSGSFLCTSFGGCNCNGSSINFGSTCNLTASGFTLTLTSPGGCEIILAPAGAATGNYNGTVFVPVGGNVIGGTFPTGGPWAPNQSFSNLNGCDPNGVWTLEFNAPGLGFGIGTLQGWSITFDDPPIYAPVDYSWSPTTGLSNTTDINTQACPVVSTDYELTVSNGTPGCATHMETVSIIVDPCGCVPPNVIIDPLQDCAPATVNLTSAINPSSDPATLTYHANQTDAQNDANPIGTTVGTSGSYWVRVEDPGDPTCFTVLEITVTIGTTDDPSFTLTGHCAGATNSASGIATAGGTFAFNPIPSDGATINPATGEITGGVSGTTYSVEYTTNGTCPSSETHTVAVFPNPVTPTITGNFSYCPGGNALLNAGSGYSTYDWSIGGASQTVTTLQQTGITVTVTNASGCSATSAPVDVIETTEFVTNLQVEICDGESAMVLGNTESTPGIYTQVYTSQSGCDSTVNVELIVHALPTPTISGALSYCPGSNTVLDAGAGYTSYDWSTGAATQTITTTAQMGITVTVTDINGCEAQSPAVNVVETAAIVTDDQVVICAGQSATIHGANQTQAGIYSQTFTTAAGCDSTSNVELIVNALPNPAITGGLSYCTGGSTQLDAGAGYAIYDWSNGAATQVISTTAINGLTVTVTDANGCSATSAPVDVTEVTEIVTNDQVVICAGETAVIHGNNESQAGVYTQTFVAAGGCDSTSNIALVVNPLPTPVIAGNLWYCEGQSALLDAGGPYTSYVWSNGGNQQTTQATAGPISVTVTDANGCTATSAQVVVDAPPVAIVNAIPSIGETPLEVILSNNSQNASTYYWDFGNGNDLAIGNTSPQDQTYTEIGEYVVMLVAEQNGCTDTAYVVITVKEPELPMVIEFPNVFTPNGDKVNDFFFFNSEYVAELEVLILNRWGNVIYESTKIDFKWDGTTNKGIPVEDGVYFYKYRATGINGEVREGHDFVTVER